MDSPTPPRELARLFGKDGVLTQMPVKAALRLELLTWIASTLPPDRVLSETELNNLIRPVHPDVATTRRYLVEARLVDRPEPGRYQVAASETAP